jgi:hypothetical protein
MHSNDFERVWLWLYRCPYYFPFCRCLMQ